MTLTQAAQAVQRSGYPDAYAQWEDVAGDITDLLGGDLPDLPDDGSTTDVANCQGDTVNPITVGTLNLLGAGHTDQPGERPGYDTWDKRLPGAMRTIENAGVSIAGLQEVHLPQAKALANQYAAKWGMYPATGKVQNRVVWDRNEWEQTDARLVDIPYFGRKDTGMPLVQLTGTAGGPSAGQVIWVWSIHNPADAQGDAAGHRKEALRRQLATMTELSGTGTPAVILGDFNDGNNSSHCALTPELTNAFGGSAEPCKKPKQDAPIDHVYGTNLTWASAEVDNSTKASKLADHPLVTATTAGSSAGCAVATETNYNLGPVKPQLTQLVNILGPMFGIKTVGGYPRERHRSQRPPRWPRRRLHGPADARGQGPRRRTRGLRPGPRPRARHRLHHLVPADLVRRSGRRGLASDGGPRLRYRQPHGPPAHQRAAQRQGLTGRPRGCEL